MKIHDKDKMEAQEVIDVCTAVPRRADVIRNDTALNKIWKPISHSRAVSSLMEAFGVHNLEVVASAFALNRSGHLMVGGFQIRGRALPQLPGNIDGTYELFFRHANDMSQSFQLNAGLHLFVCTNGMMTGERIGNHKHTCGFDLEGWARSEVVPGFIDCCGNLESGVSRLRQTPVGDAAAHRLILEAADRGILPLARTVDVYREWHHPTFPESDFGAGTAWKLYNDFTHVAQKCSPQRQLDIIEKSHELITRSLPPGLPGLGPMGEGVS